jgi:hypothetical protein
MDHPTFVRIEYWNEMTASWQTGHAGLRLMNPSTYVQKLAKRGTIARAVNPDTDEVVYGEGADLL